MLFSVVTINLKTYLLQGIGVFFWFLGKAFFEVYSNRKFVEQLYTAIANQKTLTFVSAFFTRYFRNFHERHLAKLKFEPHQYVSYEART